jgi:TetR/AcrR family transcriptional repressor of uid operon
MPRVAPAHLAAVKANLVDAALRCFERKGIDGATTRDIAEAAGVANGLLYRYFPDRDALLLAVADRLNEVRSAALLSASTDSGVVERIARIARSLFGGTGGMSLLPMLRNRATVDAQLARGLRRYDRQLVELGAGMLSEGEAAGVLRPIDPAATAEVVQCLFEGVQARLASRTVATSPERLADAAVALVLHGVAADRSLGDELVELATTG